MFYQMVNLTNHTPFAPFLAERKESKLKNRKHIKSVCSFMEDKVNKKITSNDIEKQYAIIKENETIVVCKNELKDQFTSSDLRLMSEWLRKRNPLTIHSTIVYIESIDSIKHCI